MSKRRTSMSMKRQRKTCGKKIGIIFNKKKKDNK